jgi:hypothetical protein
MKCDSTITGEKRRFSSHLYRIIDAALEIEPEDKPKPIPEFRAGQVVAVYTDSAQGQFISYGRIVTGTWEHDAWYYAIQTLGGTLISHPSCCLRAISPDEQRALWIRVSGDAHV